MGFRTVVSCLLQFHVVRGLAGGLGLTMHFSSNPLTLSSVGLSCSWAFNFRVMAFLDGVGDVPPRFRLDFGGIVPVE